MSSGAGTLSILRFRHLRHQEDALAYQLPPTSRLQHAARTVYIFCLCSVLWFLPSLGLIERFGGIVGFFARTGILFFANFNEHFNSFVLVFLSIPHDLVV